MNTGDWLKRRFRILCRAKRVDSELSDEIQLHLDMEAEGLVRQGRTRAQARREARILLGGVEQTKQAVRDTRGCGHGEPRPQTRTPEEQAAFLESSRRMFDEVRDKIAAGPAVRSVALASGLSAMNHIIGGAAFVDDRSGPPVVVSARILLVDRSYLDLMGATLAAGQSLAPADFTPQSRSVVVNEAFVGMLGGRNVVGGQIRFPERRGEASYVEVPADGTTVEIVGVVRNPAIDAFGPGPHPVIYATLDLAPVTPRAVGLVGMPQPPATQLFVRLWPSRSPASPH